MSIRLLRKHAFCYNINFSAILFPFTVLIWVFSFSHFLSTFILLYSQCVIFLQLQVAFVDKKLLIDFFFNNSLVSCKLEGCIFCAETYETSYTYHWTLQLCKNGCVSKCCRTECMMWLLPNIFIHYCVWINIYKSSSILSSFYLN